MSNNVEIIVTGRDAGALSVLGQTGEALGRLRTAGGMVGGAFSGMLGSITGPFRAAHGMMTSLVSLPNMIAAGIGGVLLRSVVSYGDALYDLNSRTQIQTDLLQALGLQAINEGNNMENVGLSLKFMARNAQEAIDGNVEFADSFAKLGVKLTDTTGKMRPMGDLYQDLAEGFSKMTNAGEKNALAMEIFGRGGGSMLRMLNQGKEGIRQYRAELEKKNMVLSQEDTAKLNALGDKWATATLQFKATFAKAMAGGAPAMGAQLDKWMDKLAALSQSGALDEWMGKVSGGLVKIADAGGKIAGFLVDNGDWLVKLGLTAYGVNILLSMTRGFYGLAAALKTAAGAKALMDIGMTAGGVAKLSAGLAGGKASAGAFGLYGVSFGVGAGVGTLYRAGLEKMFGGTEGGEAIGLSARKVGSAEALGLRKQTFMTAYQAQYGTKEGGDAAWRKSMYERGEKVKQISINQVNVQANDFNQFVDSIPRAAGAEQL